MAVKGMGGEKVEINDLFEGFNYFVKSWVFMILAVIIIGIGYLFLVLPGIILSILMIYALPLLVIRDYGAMDSIKESIEISKNNFVDALVLAIILTVISAIGGMVYVGSLLTVPFTLLALVAALEAQVGAGESYTAEYTEVSDVE
jgi:uncharacterized membrane protein